MCKETFNVIGLNNQRTAYEVEEFLLGHPHVDTVQADFISDKVIVEYDETEVCHDRILDTIEHAGCKPSERTNGFFDRIRAKVTHG